jgi:hypothetical protein
MSRYFNDFGAMHGESIEHHGVLGMKWGVRRYRSKNGSLTNSGKRRYGTKNNRTKRQYKHLLNDLNEEITTAKKKQKRAKAKPAKVSKEYINEANRDVSKYSKELKTVEREASRHYDVKATPKQYSRLTEGGGVASALGGIPGSLLNSAVRAASYPEELYMDETTKGKKYRLRNKRNNIR